MSFAGYLQTLEAIEQETAKLLETRSRIDHRLSQLKTTADSLRALVGQPLDPSLASQMIGGLINEVPAESGITDAIRQVLSKSKIPLSALEIKSGLENSGVDLSGYANPGAVIHNTLTRLEKQREVVRLQTAAGQTVAYAINSMYKKLFDM